MEIGVLVVVAVGVFLGFLVLQGTFAARAWRERIASGDLEVLREALDAAFESWREMRPPKGMPSADWAALASAELVAADRDRARASLIADADVRVVAGGRREVAGPLAVGRRAALRMAERLLYEIPHVRFAEVQVDVWERFRDASGATRTRALLTTRATREQAAGVDWAARWELPEPDPAAPAEAGEGSGDGAGGAAGDGVRKNGAAGAGAPPRPQPGEDPARVLAGWRTRESPPGGEIDPDRGALISPGEGITLQADAEADAAGAARAPVAGAGR